MKLKIFADRSYLPNNLPTTLKYVPILIPFWGEIPEDPKHFKAGRFDKFLDRGQTSIEMTDLVAADLVIFPAHWHLIKENPAAYQLAMQLLENAKIAKKPVAIFSQGDWNSDENIDNTLIFYTSSFQSTRKPNEFAMPEWTSDFVADNFGGQIAVREKQTKPKVGFCGYAPPLGIPFGLKKLKGYLRMGGDMLGLTEKFYHKNGHTDRVLALSNLSKNAGIETNFAIRGNFAFSSQALAADPIDPEKIARQLRLEFCRNIIESDYVVCCSGYENYSIRFYETLSMGRIPILLNTDCVLPYDFAIDWKKYCVWVEKNELNSIADKVIDFHRKLSAQDFIDLQHECRRVWEEWISPEGFFNNFYRHLEKVSQS